MFIIECSNPMINNGLWFSVWRSDLNKSKSGETIEYAAADALRCCVQVEWREDVQYRMIYKRG